MIFFFLNMGTLISQYPLSTFSFIDILTSCHAFNKHSLKTASIDGWGHRCGEQSISINWGEKNNLIKDTIFQARMCHPVWLLRKKQEYSWYRKKRVANTLISFKKKSLVDMDFDKGVAAVGRRGAERSYSTFKVRRGGREKIPPPHQGKEQWLRFAGAAVKRYPTSEVRETQVRWKVLREGIREQTH